MSATRKSLMEKLAVPRGWPDAIHKVELRLLLSKDRVPDWYRHHLAVEEAYAAAVKCPRVERYVDDHRRAFVVGELQRVEKRLRKFKTRSGEAASAEEVVLIIQRFGYHCAYCNGMFQQIDHFIPLSRGGRNDSKNMVPACKPCNLSKGDKMPMEWCFEKFGAVGFYSVRHG